MLVANPTASGVNIIKSENKESEKETDFKEKISGYVRAALDLQGTDVLHAALHDVLAAGGELHAPALEVLLIVDGDLPDTRGQTGRSPQKGSSHCCI